MASTAAELPHLLLRPGETRVPDAVLRTSRFLAQLGVRARLSRNAPATSCRDAARKRVRLGMQGIPLADELKSFLGRYPDGDGAWRRVMIHCRGDQELDLERVATLLRASGPVQRLDEADLAAFGVAYGTVNPFDGGTALHVFDVGLRERRGLPGTVMTNAGEHTWGVELYADELVDAMGDAIVGEVVQQAPRPEQVAPIGILAASGTAGRALWQHLDDAVRLSLGAEFRGDLSLPGVVVRSVPELSLAVDLEYRRREVARALLEAVRSLCAEGVRSVALASHPAHALADELGALCASLGVRLVGMQQAVAAELARDGVGAATVLGRGAAELWGGLSSAVAFEAPSPRDEAAMEALIGRVQREGASEACRQQLRDLLGRDGIREHVILAEAELALLVQTQRRPGGRRVLIDALQAQGRWLARAWLGRDRVAA